MIDKIGCRYNRATLDTVRDLVDDQMFAWNALQNAMVAFGTSKTNPCSMRLRIEESAQFDVYEIYAEMTTN